MRSSGRHDVIRFIVYLARGSLLLFFLVVALLLYYYFFIGHENDYRYFVIVRGAHRKRPTNDFGRDVAIRIALPLPTSRITCRPYRFVRLEIVETTVSRTT